VEESLLPVSILGGGTKGVLEVTDPTSFANWGYVQVDEFVKWVLQDHIPMEKKMECVIPIQDALGWFLFEMYSKKGKVEEYKRLSEGINTIISAGMARDTVEGYKKFIPTYFAEHLTEIRKSPVQMLFRCMIEKEHRFRPGREEYMKGKPKAIRYMFNEQMVDWVPIWNDLLETNGVNNQSRREAKQKSLRWRRFNQHAIDYKSSKSQPDTQDKIVEKVLRLNFLDGMTHWDALQEACPSAEEAPAAGKAAPPAEEVTSTAAEDAPQTAEASHTNGTVKSTLQRMTRFHDLADAKL